MAQRTPRRDSLPLMRRLNLFPGDSPVRRVLALGAHADDIEIGCGATLLALTRAQPGIEVTWVVFGARGERDTEARRSAEAFLSAAGTANVTAHGFRDGFFPHAGVELKDLFEELKLASDPDVIFTHGRHDLHQDHRVICELTWNTWRHHLIFEYEIPKYDGDIGSPNVFVSVSNELATEKARLIWDAFPSQRSKHWFDNELFLAFMRIRGMEAASESGYAEAFTCRKLSLLVE
jgi:LmbE family N-acetylglucosaminyl deacetylase